MTTATPAKRTDLDENINVPINSADKAELEAEATALGIRGVATYVRNIILGITPRMKKKRSSADNEERLAKDKRTASQGQGG